MIMDTNSSCDDALEPIWNQLEKIHNSLNYANEHQQRLNEILKPVVEQNNLIQATLPKLNPITTFAVNNPLAEVKSELENNKFVMGVGKLAIKSAMPSYAYDNPTLKAIEAISKSAIVNLASGLTTLVESTTMKQIQVVTSAIGNWLKNINFTPLVSIVQTLAEYGFAYDYEDVDEIYLKAMFDARWFPYAAWVADFRIVDAIFDILDTSRASQNRIKRIDKLIFSYYNQEELMNLKRGWRKLNLPSYMTRILIQSVQAYNRKEYALTVATLSTLWEGIIQEKVKDDSYRVSRKTRDNLTKLIKENEFNDIFSSFCNEFIFYDCLNPEQVKADVPGRHSIAHCWYNTYPNRKVALNAIIFTDFLLRLEPLDKQEDENNG